MAEVHVIELLAARGQDTVDSVIEAPTLEFQHDLEQALANNGIDYETDGNEITIHWDCP